MHCLWRPSKSIAYAREISRSTTSDLQTVARWTDLEREGLLLVELDEKDRDLVVRGHDFALLVSAGALDLSASANRFPLHQHALQSTRVEGLDEIGQALPLDSHFRGKDIISDGQG